ncbi:MAG: SpoIID/LytB domain-containing protein, partial [Acidimicrobiia bacterium]|nr:SpoIID/LytB domain-containing protein [Acidimicrobiia bacterium]
VVTIEDYLAGVVPNEVPASWPDAALQAQAVAARSYALAGDTRQQPYADTCDTTRCQVYDGAYTERNGSFRSSTHSRTDAAIVATAGQVRLHSDGSVARTEFSSSTGGYTAGGDFPAVVDDGDSVSANPNHTWSTTVSAATIEARYDLGHLLAMDVVERNGLGADGGRAVTVEFRFEQGTVSETGDSVRSFLGLKSNWFTPGSVVGPDRSGTPEAAYIDRTYQTFTGRAATSEEIETWFDEVAAGDRRAITDALVTSEFFLGELVDDLYQTALGRAPDDGGRAYWIDRLRNGVKLESVGVLFYGSQEYYDSAGGTDAAFVSALYRDILGREPDPGGQAYWEGMLARGAARLDDVASGFYSSLESRRARAMALHLRLRGVAAGDEARDALAGRLVDVDDLVVAAEIAASQEAYDG